MSSLLAVTYRELRLRWTLLAAALSLGFVPLLAPVFGFRFAEPQFVGLVLSVLMGALAALLTGASVIGADLGSCRLGFFFSRPLAWWAIWGGKLLAAVLLTLGAGLLAAVPWMASGLGGPLRLRSLWDPQGAVYFVSLVLLLVGLGHAASVAYRSRSAWLLVDLGLLAALVLLIRASADLILLGGFALGGLYRIRHAVVYLWLLIDLVLVLASAVEVAWGRTDIRRGHMALSISLWAMLFLGVGSLLGFGSWLKSATPGDLDRVVTTQVAPQGNWIEVRGESRGRGDYHPHFLYDAATGRHMRLDWWGLLWFSPRGDRAIGLQVDPWGRRLAGTLRMIDLAERAFETALPRIELGPSKDWVTSLAFDPTGDRLAVVRQSALSVFELSSGRLLASVPAASGKWLPSAVFFFGDSDRLRWLRRWGEGGAVVQIVEVRLPGGQTQVTGQVAASAIWPQWDDSGERLLVWNQTGPGSVSLLDGRSGALLAKLSEPGEHRNARAGFLSDGRIAVSSEEDNRSLLQVCRRDGTEERRLQLGPGLARLGAEPQPGRLYVGLKGPSKGHTVLVDLDQGSILGREEGLLPAVSWPFGPRPRPGTPGAALFLSDDGALVRLDPTTGQRTVLLGGKG